MSDLVPVDDFYTPANLETINFRLGLIKNYPRYIQSKPQRNHTFDEKHTFQLTKRSNFTGNGAIAKIVEYEDNQILFSTHRGDVSGYNLDTDEYSTIYNHNNTRVSALSYIKDAGLIVSGAQDGTLSLMKSGKLTQSEIHKDRIVDICSLNHSLNNVLSISHDKTWSLLDLNDYEAPLYKQDGYTSPLTAMSLSCFDHLFITATIDEIQMHDLRSGVLVGRSKNVDKEPCHDMKILNNNHTLIAGGQGKLKIFDLRRLNIDGINDCLIDEKLVHQGNLVTSMDLKDDVLVSTGFKDASVEINTLRNGIIENINDNKKDMVIAGDKLLTSKIMDDGQILTAGFNSKINFI
ncbi:uncharacterized protein HGUI_03104 [Hanseniaspora guilliermondii]|uniref:Uncharacterized protein n=1 Tax=Hanseniaspora guilliermondii TaxID=56406 RepID=A0A1L0B347_9ASCO|nr:uncharacterized protein HGUI_03104 [Hanseniaspora guilliermondii]